MQGANLKDFLTSAKIADSLGVHKTTVNRIASEHNLGVLIGQQKFFSKKKLRKSRVFAISQKATEFFEKQIENPIASTGAFGRLSRSIKS